jgi:putative protein kinase ArgK-like GTPase of G3E family
VLLTQAAADVGIDALMAAISRHAEYLHAHRDPMRENERRTREFVEVLTAELEERTKRALNNGAGDAQAILSEVREGNLNPYSAARRIIENGAVVAELLAQGSAKPNPE